MNIQLQTQQSIRTAQFISSSLLLLIRWCIECVYSVCIQTPIPSAYSPKRCRRTYAANDVPHLCVTVTVSVCVRALWLHIIGLCSDMDIWVCVCVKLLSQPTSYAFLMRYDVRCMNTKFEMEWIEFGLLFNKNCDSSLLLRWKFEHNFNLSFQRLNRGKSNSCVQWILGLFENVRMIANTEKAGLKISKISKISYRQFAHLFFGQANNIQLSPKFNSLIPGTKWSPPIWIQIEFQIYNAQELSLNASICRHIPCHIDTLTDRHTLFWISTLAISKKQISSCESKKECVCVFNLHRNCKRFAHFW